MDFRLRAAFCLPLSLLLLCIACLPLTSVSHDKATIWNYDNGIYFATDGSLSTGPCFRLSGRVTAPTFFANLKRIDFTSQTIFQRGTKVVTQFPDHVFLGFHIEDLPCSFDLKEIAPQKYLTPEIVSTLRFSFYWKRGVELEPAKNVVQTFSFAEPVAPYATDLASELPPRYDWACNFVVPSAGVPLTDHFVIVVREPDGKVAARVAARL